MRVYRSNRMRKLSEALAKVLRQPSGPANDLIAVTRPEVVVVHSQGMARWLEMELARHLKISSNIEFPFPKSTIRDAMTAVLDDDPEAWKAWQPEVMLWSTLEALEGLLDTPPFEALATYLTGRTGGDAITALGTADGVLLARQIADVFDRYVTYRPDLILDWATPTPSDDWQAVLWRAVSARITTHNLAQKGTALQAQLAQRLPGDTGRPSGLSPRLCLFGISTMPPFFLDLFQKLDRVCEIHLFVLCPSNVYWADIRSKREIARALKRDEREGKDSSIEALHLEEGNPLLASFGRMGRDFQVVLEGGEAQGGYQDVEAFSDPAETSRKMLHILQSDILHLRHRGSGESDLRPAKLEIDDTDGPDTSVQVHACYGAMRQVEALRDELIGRLEDDLSLEPRDIVVMTPDIERFAPLIEAVFGDLGSTPKIPVRIADRPVGKENPVAELLVRVMAMTDTRLTGPEVLDLLSLAPVQSRFKLQGRDLSLIEEWVKETGIRWGIDAEDRERVGQPGADGLNTWRFGLNRMLLGVAMPGEEAESFQGVLPYDEIEGGDAVTAGRLADACEALFGAMRLLRDGRRRTPQAWVKLLKGLVDTLVALPDNDAWRIQQVHELLDQLSEEADLAESTKAVTFQSIRALMTRRLDTSQRASGFVTGAVTFCAMVPMRSVPFKVVVLLGMDEDAFPRKQRVVDFDKTYQQKRTGDRNPRDEDRYLMLEALLSAQDAMVIIYNGHDSQTGKERPPAAPVDELLEVLDESFEGARARIVNRHPLHAFSPTLFGVSTDPDDMGGVIDSVSHDERLVPAARSMLANTVEAPARFRGSVSAPDGLDEVSIHELTSFFEHTAKSFLNKRLGLHLPSEDEGLNPREPLNAGNNLEKWALRNAALLQRQTAPKADDDALYERAKLTGKLALGLPGRVEHEELVSALPAMMDKAEALIDGGVEQGLDVDLAIDGTRIVGRIDGIRGDGGPRVEVSVSTSAQKYHLRLWIKHVIRRAFEADKPPAPSYLVMRKGTNGAETICLGERLTPAEATAYLSTLIGYFKIGQQVPLLFFPKTSWKYIDRFRVSAKKVPDETAKKGPEAAREWLAELAWQDAIKAWKGDNFSRAERDDHHLMLWGTEHPFAPDFKLPNVPPDLWVPFATLAETIWRPFINEKEKSK
ncbi:MAG: exodeoxyribonuclease V subunit gamma [Myxococcota bacterium]